MIARARANADRLGNGDGRRPEFWSVTWPRWRFPTDPSTGRQHSVDAPLGRPGGRPGRDRPRAVPRRPSGYLGSAARRPAPSVRTTPRAHPPIRSTTRMVPPRSGECDALALALEVHPHSADRTGPRRPVTLFESTLACIGGHSGGCHPDRGSGPPPGAGRHVGACPRRLGRGCWVGSGRSPRAGLRVWDEPVHAPVPA